MSRTFHDMFRPAYEGTAAAGWAAASVGLLATTPPLWPMLTLGALALSFARGREAFNLFKFRASITSLRVEEITTEDAMQIARRHINRKKNASGKTIGGFWLGRGFQWTQKHAEIAWTIMHSPPASILPPPPWLPNFVHKKLLPPNSKELDQDTIGVPWIHGIEPEESEVDLSIESLEGHTLVVGTTRSGKTRLYELLTTQIVHKGDTLIVIDPKGDKDWEQRLRHECKKAGRKFLYFHPAHPSKSIRINPLANWNSLSEPATRIGQLIDAEGTFAAFAWKTLYRVNRGIVADGNRPTIKGAKEYIQLGVEPLLERLIKKTLIEREGASWDANLSKFAGTKAAPKGAPPGADRLEMMIAKYKSFDIRDEVIDSLVSMVHHSKEHYSKMIQVLEPILEMLGSDEIGKMLSPDPLDLSDTRPIYDTQKIIEENAVLYVGLDSLSNKIIGSAIGSILLADIASVAGAIYNFKKKTDVYLFVDEAAEVVNEQAIQILNKGGGAGIKAFYATQTIADFDAVFGATARTKQALGNLNNVICLRVKDPDMAKWIAESFGKTSARSIDVSFGSGAESSSSFTEFRSNVSRSLKKTEVPLVSQDLLTRLPGLQYFAFLGGSTLYKGRLPLFPKPSELRS